MSIKWFAAHVLMYVQFKKEVQSVIPCWENIYLIKASSEEEAFAKAEKLGLSKEGDEGGSFTWDGKEATWVFGGVRKLTCCENPDEAPTDGTEVTYLEYLVPSRKTIDALMNSKDAKVTLHDQ